MSDDDRATLGDGARAMDTISRAAFRRKSLLARISLRLGLTPTVLQLLLITIALGVAGACWMYVTQSRASSPVAVILPGKTAAGEEGWSVHGVGEPQYDGFTMAWSTVSKGRALGYPNREFYSFPLPDLIPDPSGSGYLEQREYIDFDTKLEQLYDRGIRYFIITMSQTVRNITAEGGVWDAFRGRHPIDPPTLLATAVSAPDIADVDRRIMRLYVRSDDEVNQFAAYLDSQSVQVGEREIFVFYIDDQYGRRARDLIEKKIGLDHEASVAVTPGQTDLATLRAQFKETVLEELSGDVYTVVMLVLYGDGLKNMLDLLNEHADLYHTAFNAHSIDEVLTVSTITEAAWQPDFYRQTYGQFLPRITSVEPAAGGLRHCVGVVCRFAYMTLYVALACDEERAMDDFLDCVMRASGQVPEDGFEIPDIELSARGDSIVPLRVNVVQRPKDR